MKNYVGAIGEKAYLAHYSSNLSKSGGDCFPGIIFLDWEQNILAKCHLNIRAIFYITLFIMYPQ